LQGLCVLINGPEHIQFACVWIISCILLHSFAMDYEEGTDLSSDEFYQEGLWLVDAEHLHWTAHQTSAEAHVQAMDSEREAAHDLGLLEGRLFRENLKTKLFLAL